MRIHYRPDFHPGLGNLRAPPLLFRRQPPQLNYPPNNVPRNAGLESKYIKGGISRMAPPRLASELQRLPPILHIIYPNPMSSCSEAARGLFVLPQLIGIFTDIVISPSLCLRQYSHHYTIRAGQNLPDKEFRYLRTVIVTAAVYWGLVSKLRLAANLST